MSNRENKTARDSKDATKTGAGTYDEHERPIRSRDSSSREAGGGTTARKEHRDDSGRNSSTAISKKGGEEKRGQGFHRMSRSNSSIGASLDLLTAQQEVAGQKQVNKEEARRLKQLSLKLEQERKLINQHRANLEKDKEVSQFLMNKRYSKKEHRDDSGRNSSTAISKKGGEEKRGQGFHRMSRSNSSIGGSLDLLTAQQEVAGEKQVNKEEARRLKQLSLKLEQETKLINQHRANLEKDKEVHRKEQNQLQDRKRDLKKRESEVEDLRSKNETEQNRLNRWHADLDTREKVINQKEKKLLRSQQEFEEHKKREMLAVHTQRQTDIDSVKEENDRLRAQMLKEIEERREMERSYIQRDQEVLRQERINQQRKTELADQSLQTREAGLRDGEQALLHEKRKLNMEKDRLDQMRHEIELLKSQVSLENKVKEENAQLAARLLEEKRQTDEAMNNRMRDKLKVEISKKEKEIEQRQNKYEKHNLSAENEIDHAKKNNDRKLDEKEKLVELRAEQSAKILKAQQKSWETTQFEKIKSLSASIVS